MKHIFDNLLETNSRLAKEAILRQYSDDANLREVLRLALDPFIKFYVKKIPKYAPTIIGEPDYGWKEIFERLEVLSTRQKTGNAAVEWLRETFDGVSPDDATVLEKIIRKDLRCGVSTPTVNKIFPKLIRTFECQAAAQYDEKSIPLTGYVEPKIDGMRVLVFVEENGDVSFLSRNGKEIETLDHIIPELQSISLSYGGFVLDCEATAGTFQNTMSVVKRLGENKQEELAKLRVFDLIPLEEFKSKKVSLNFEGRRTELETLVFNEFREPFEYLILNSSEFYSFQTQKEAVEFVQSTFKKHLKEGFEGSIVKQASGKYEFKRSNVWIKVKPTETIDVEIEKVVEGSGKYVGMMGALEYTYDGVECSVGTGFSDNDRKWFWDNRNIAIGMIIEIMFMEKTRDGATRHSRFLALRDFKGEKA